MQRFLIRFDMRVSRSLILVALTAASLAEVSADDWKSFQNGGVPIASDAGYAAEWSPESGIAWQQPLAGYGQSTPVVMGNRIFVTSVSGDLKERLHVQAFDLKTGTALWKFDTKNSSPVKSTNYVSKAAPSPVCDGNGVIALFEGGNVVALTSDGARRWERDLVADYGSIESRHGLSSSLEQTEELVFVWIERSEEPYVLALSKKTGKTVWKANGLGVTSWSSPRLVPVGETHHLVLSGIGRISGLDPSTGKKLWEFDGISGNSTPTPVPLGSGRFLIGATVGRGESGGGKAAESNGVIQISGSPADGFKLDYVWRAKSATSSFGSPIAHNGLAWFVNREGILYCLDAKTGDQKFAQRTASSVWATPLLIGDRLYLFGKNGTTTILNASAEFDVLAENSLWETEHPGDQSESSGEPVLYAAVASDSTLVLRRGDRLFAIRP
tara:strand:+ start:198988 stop:200310 length:1323 start_codon:yes stop_codon:yes gene_type:complete